VIRSGPPLLEFWHIYMYYYDIQMLSTLPTLEHEHSLSVGRAAVLETGPLPLQDHKSGTVCRPISDYVGCHMASSGCY